MATKLSKNEMLIFGLHSTSDDRPTNPSHKSHPKCKKKKKKAAKSSKNEMLIFGLCSTSDDQLSNLSNKSCPKCEKMAAKLSKNEMLIFANYVQLLMISQAIQVIKVVQNAKKNGKNFYGKIDLTRN